MKRSIGEDIRTIRPGSLARELLGVGLLVLLVMATACAQDEPGEVEQAAAGSGSGSADSCACPKACDDPVSCGDPAQCPEDCRALLDCDCPSACQDPVACHDPEQCPAACRGAGCQCPAACSDPARCNDRVWCPADCRDPILCPCPAACADPTKCNDPVGCPESCRSRDVCACPAACDDAALCHDPTLCPADCRDSDTCACPAECDDPVLCNDPTLCPVYCRDREPDEGAQTQIPPCQNLIGHGIRSCLASCREYDGGPGMSLGTFVYLGYCEGSPEQCTCRGECDEICSGQPCTHGCLTPDAVVTTCGSYCADGACVCRAQPACFAVCHPGTTCATECEHAGVATHCESYNPDTCDHTQGQGGYVDLTVQGTVYSYPDVIGGPERPVAGRPVTIQEWYVTTTEETYGYQDPENGGFVEVTVDQCHWNQGADATLQTGSDGWYSTVIRPFQVAPLTHQCTWSDPVGRWSPIVTQPAHRLVISSPGSEATTDYYQASQPKFPLLEWDLRRAPHAVSDDGAVWARRLGTGRYPIFDFEGFDPIDGIKSGRQACNGAPEDVCHGRLEMIYGSRLLEGETPNLYTYLASHDFTLWEILTGPNGGNSLMGNRQDRTDGLAYSMVRLSKQLRDRNHARTPMVVGGYSMGGPLARAGLLHWCNGDWASVSGGVLDAGCPAVSLWWSGDGPNQGARANVALQRYIKDATIGPLVPPRPRYLVDSPAARELLAQWIQTWPTCNVNCYDLFGCDSTEGDFDDGCTFDNSRRIQFASWSGQASLAYPTRSGIRIPSIAFAVGTLSSPICDSGNELVQTDVNNAGDHHLRLNTAGGTGECDPGSMNGSLEFLHGMHGDGWRLLLRNRYPTFISTASALDVPRQELWNDYWYNTVNANHVAPFPPGAARFLLAWSSEYLHGRRQLPVCGIPEKTVGMKGQCRPAEPETCNGKDDDGDDLIDEACQNGGIL